jgi:uncharacterized protein
MNMPVFDPSTEKYVSLATFRKTGAQVLTPVCIAKAGDCFYVYSEGRAGKVKRIRANGRARIAPCTFKGTVTGNWLDCRARVVEDQATINRAYVGLKAKYGLTQTLVDFFSKLAGKYNKRAIIELKVES